ncbi:hypothetical protein ACL02O_29990 [Micromonospora sp. MS34]|uniref:hypothetical protein n=1 Tax=Micromonospora sp. MS34 TaxID=3385971 RepID=UPI0039A251A1
MPDRERFTATAGTCTPREPGRHPFLLAGFAFAIMADPVSSVAYAIEAALRALHGDLRLLLPTSVLVIAVIALVVVNYHQIVGRYPNGGGAAAAAGEAFGEGWAFLPIGALIVDYVLTIGISCAAAAAAVIAYLPALAPLRVPIGLGLVVVVGGLSWFGALGRAVFAVMTVGFVALALLVLGFGAFAAPRPEGTASTVAPHTPVLAVVLAFPAAMALATGVEAPSSAIAQLGQLGDAGRRRFGRATLWTTIGIVGVLTIGFAAEAHRLQIGVPPPHSTQIAELARVAAPPPVFVAFQATTALLLLAAAGSSYQAGPGLLKALSRARLPGGRGVGILPAGLGRTNRWYTPFHGVLLFMILALVVTAAGGAQDQRLVLFYAVSVFVSFLAGLSAIALFSHRERRRVAFVVNAVAAAVVAFTLVVNVARGAPVVSLVATMLIAAVLHHRWVRAGRPRGVQHATAD